MLKKAKIRLLTRAAHCRECVFSRVYRAATVRESVPKRLFSSLLGDNERRIDMKLERQSILGSTVTGYKVVENQRACGCRGAVELSRDGLRHPARRHCQRSLGTAGERIDQSGIA